MRKWLVILILVISKTIIAQEIIVEFNVYKDKSYENPLPNAEIIIWSDQDTIQARTDQNGFLAFKSTDSTQNPIQLNRNYTVSIISDDAVHELIDHFSTFITTNTKIIRDLHIQTVHCFAPTITFEFKGKIWQKDNSHTLNQFYNLLEDNENIILQLEATIKHKKDNKLGLELTNMVRDSLIRRGIDPVRINLSDICEIDSAALNIQIDFRVESFDYVPCTGLNVINFDKNTNTIIETRCDSLKFMYQEILASEDTYAIIGIYHNRDDHSYNDKAKARAELVMAKLIQMGVPKNRMEIYTQYYPEPAVKDYHDWPFYPEDYTYEIGVVLNLAP